MHMFSNKHPTYTLRNGFFHPIHIPKCGVDERKGRC